MNQNQPTDPTPLPDASVIQERVAASVHSHQRKIRVLTGMAFVFGFLAITASIAIVSAYFVLYLPKQRQMLQDFGASARVAHAAPEENSSKPKYDFAATEVVMTHVISIGTMLVAVAVGLLSLGTLVMLLLVVLHRRATLNQISVSLAQISNQLKDLQPRQSKPS